MGAEVYVGLGSNIEPERHLRAAVEALQARLGPTGLSSVYRNPAVGFSGDDFLNLVLRARCVSGPDSVEQALSEIEQAAGRLRSDRTLGPRVLDLDLLLFGTLVDPDQRLPRADILRYAFVLCPIAELAPTLVHPVSGETMAAAWREMAAHSPPMKSMGRLMSDSVNAGHGADLVNR